MSWPPLRASVVLADAGARSIVSRPTEVRTRRGSVGAAALLSTVGQSELGCPTYEKPHGRCFT